MCSNAYNRNAVSRFTMADATPDHYEVLGVGLEASISEIRKAFRAKALEFHPDKNVGREKEAGMP